MGVRQRANSLPCFDPLNIFRALTGRSTYNAYRASPPVIPRETFPADRPR
jgi:hypothetical protein